MPNQRININNKSHLKQAINMITLDIEKMSFQKIININYEIIKYKL